MTKITVERDAILAALAFVGKYAATDNKTPIVANVAIKADGGRVHLIATNAEQAAADSCPAEIEKPGALCLPAALLLKAVKSSSGDVTISADEKQATVTIGKSRFKLPVLPIADFPDMPMLTVDGDCEFPLDGSVIARIAHAVAFAAEEPKGRYYLAGVSWRIDGGKLEFTATDGKQLSKLSIDAPTTDMPPLIAPLIDMPAWAEPVQIAVTPTFIRFQCGNQTLASRLVDGSYPDTTRIIPDNKTSIITDRAELLASLARVALVVEGERSILFVGRDGKLTVSAVTAAGEASDDVAYHGEDFQIAIAHHVITPILSSFDCETIEIRVADHQTAATIHDPNDASRITMAMPYREKRLAEYIHVERIAAE